MIFCRKRGSSPVSVQLRTYSLASQPFKDSEEYFDAAELDKEETGSSNNTIL